MCSKWYKCREKRNFKWQYAQNKLDQDLKQQQQTNIILIPVYCNISRNNYTGLMYSFQCKYINHLDAVVGTLIENPNQHCETCKPNMQHSTTINKSWQIHWSDSRGAPHCPPQTCLVANNERIADATHSPRDACAAVPCWALCGGSSSKVSRLVWGILGFSPGHRMRLIITLSLPRCTFTASVFSYFTLCLAQFRCVTCWDFLLPFYLFVHLHEARALLEESNYSFLCKLVPVA